MTAAPDPGQIGRRLLLKAMMAALLLLAACTVASWYACTETFRGEIVPEFRRQAQNVSANLAYQVTRALGLGIPLNELVGVPQLFEAFLGNNPQLSYVELHDAQDRPLFAAHRKEPDSVPAPHLSTAAERDVAIPIEVDDAKVATLHVGIATLHMAAFFTDSVWYLAMLGIGGAVVMVGALFLLIRRRVAAPLAEIDRVQRQFAGGDWAVRASVTGVPELRRVLVSLNGAFQQAAEQWRRVDWLANEVAAVDARLTQPARGIVDALPGKADSGAAP